MSTSFLPAVIVNLCFKIIQVCISRVLRSHSKESNVVQLCIVVLFPGKRKTTTLAQLSGHNGRDITRTFGLLKSAAFFRLRPRSRKHSVTTQMLHYHVSDHIISKRTMTTLKKTVVKSEAVYTSNT